MYKDPSKKETPKLTPRIEEDKALPDDDGARAASPDVGKGEPQSA